MSVVGDRIREARIARGYSQEELAQAIGASKATVSRYESGAREPRTEQLEKIAGALNVSISSFFVPENAAMDSLELGTMFNTYHTICAVVMESPEVPSQIKKFMEDNLPEKKEFVDRLIALTFQSVRAERPDDEWSVLEESLLNAFERLNLEGQRVAVLRVEELAEISRYQNKDDGLIEP